MTALAAVLIAVWSDDATADQRRLASLMPPVTPACVSSSFGPRILPNLPAAGTYHYGIDLPAASGASVFAAATGTVIRVQNRGPGGLEMLVQHDGFVGVYSHFGMVAPAFADGKRTVEAGEKLGVVGTTGVTFGAHLYFEMIVDGRPVDPAPYLRVPPCNGDVRPSSPYRSDDGGTMVDGRRYLAGDASRTAVHSVAPELEHSVAPELDAPPGNLVVDLAPVSIAPPNRHPEALYTEAAAPIS